MKRSALIVTVLPLVVIACLVYEFAHSPWTLLRIAGLFVLIPALILLTIARIQLGNSFSLAPRATQLVTRGIYSRIRNPILRLRRLRHGWPIPVPRTPAAALAACAHGDHPD